MGELKPLLSASFKCGEGADSSGRGGGGVWMRTQIRVGACMIPRVAFSPLTVKVWQGWVGVRGSSQPVGPKQSRAV